MAKLGDAPSANQYDGIATGPQFAYLFETQAGIPVDGTNALLRDLSPFTLRLIPPDALLRIAAESAQGLDSLEFETQQSVVAQETYFDLIEAAALGSTSNANSVAAALATVSAIGGLEIETIAKLEAFVVNGEFVTGQEGFNSSLADAFTAADISLQLSRILQASPLTLLINPADMTITHPKIQSFSSRTRKGFVFEAWGEDQPSISFSGSTAGFVAGAFDTSSPYGAQTVGEASSVTGYQWAARRDSAAWQNFMGLYHFYRSNGYLYDTLGKSEAHLFIGSVAIDYDQWTYIGNIDSLSFRFEEGSPHKVTFDMEFKVSRMYDSHQSSATVIPQTSPTASPTSTAIVTGSGATTTQTTLSGRQATSRLGDVDQAQVPLDLLGEF